MIGLFESNRLHPNVKCSGLPYQGYEVETRCPKWY